MNDRETLREAMNFIDECATETFVLKEDEFSYKVAQAKIAGKDAVNFNGKEYPVDMSEEQAKKILDTEPDPEGEGDLEYGEEPDRQNFDA